MSGFKVAVAGATGNVGREMLAILAERRFPVSEVVALASPASIGREVSFGDRILKCKALENYDFSDTDICLMSAGGAVSKEWSPRIGAKGCVVIDNSSAWRMDPDVPLIVPEVNADAAKGFSKEEHHRQPQLLDRPARRGAEAAARARKDQARGGGDLSIGVGGRQGRDGRTVLADARGVHDRSDHAEEVPQAHRLQPHPADRRLHGRRLDQGRVEDGRRDQEDPRSQDQADRDLRARAGVHQPFGGGQYRIRASRSAPTRRARSSPRRPAASSSTAASPAATSPRTRRPARTRPISAASARTRRSSTASTCGSSPTICARARRSTRCRSPRC